MMLSRRWVVAGLLCGAADAALAETVRRSPVPVPRGGQQGASVASPAARAPSADALIAQAKLDGKVGYVVADAATGQVLEAHDPDTPLPPASTAKAITAIYALSGLGAGHRFVTRVLATGPVQNGEVQGDLVLAGGGDPSLDTDALAELAARLKQSGVRGIKGRFLVHGGALPHLNEIDGDQPEHVGYNPALSGLNLNFNRVHFEWKRNGKGYATTMDARSDKYRPEVTVARVSIENRQLPVYTYAANGGVDRWTVANTALGQGGSRWLPVRQPEAYAAEVFQGFARAHGIVLPTARGVSDLPGGTVVAQWDSPPLIDLVREMLKYSTNLTAEALGLTATSARQGATPGTLRASSQQMNDWLGAQGVTRKAQFRDHSGLSDGSRISAQDMVDALVRLGPKVGLRGLMKSVPLLDTQGRPIKNSAVQIQAKTGTLNFVSALCGYVRTPEGKDLAFAIFCADTARRAKIARADREDPKGGRGWTRNARVLHSQLINRWSTLYGA